MPPRLERGILVDVAIEDVAVGSEADAPHGVIAVVLQSDRYRYGQTVLVVPLTTNLAESTVSPVDCFALATVDSYAHGSPVGQRPRFVSRGPSAEQPFDRRGTRTRRSRRASRGAAGANRRVQILQEPAQHLLFMHGTARGHHRRSQIGVP